MTTLCRGRKIMLPKFGGKESERGETPTEKGSNGGASHMQYQMTTAGRGSEVMTNDE